MAKRKIRHALVSYVVTDENGKAVNFETAFRNQVVDIPDDQVERLDNLGATVAPDDELERPGTMSALPDAASDAEILSWVIGATNSEVEALVKQRPVMAERILAAHASVAERFDEQNIHLGGLQEIADEATAAAQLQADLELLGSLSDEDLSALIDLDNEGLTSDEVTALAQQAQAEEADLIGETGEFTAEDADKLVAGSAKDVIDYISENPKSASIILDAEGRRAVAAKEDARVTIVRAAEAAAGFTQ